MMASYGAEGYNSTNGRRVLQQATNQPYNGHIVTLTHLDSKQKITYLGSVRENVEASKVADNVVAVFTDNGKESGALINQYGEKVILQRGEGVEEEASPADVGWMGQIVQWFPEYLDQVPWRK